MRGNGTWKDNRGKHLHHHFTRYSIIRKEKTYRFLLIYHITDVNLYIAGSSVGSGSHWLLLP